MTLGKKNCKLEKQNFPRTSWALKCPWTCQLVTCCETRSQTDVVLTAEAECLYVVSLDQVMTWFSWLFCFFCWIIGNHMIMTSVPTLVFLLDFKCSWFREMFTWIWRTELESRMFRNYFLTSNRLSFRHSSTLFTHKHEINVDLWSPKKSNSPKYWTAPF